MSQRHVYLIVSRTSPCLEDDSGRWLATQGLIRYKNGRKSFEDEPRFAYFMSRWNRTIYRARRTRAVS
jgi:hypothetical protein